MNIRWCVVITTHNRAPMLRRAIESCLNQTVACEIIVVDDASSDNTRQLVSEFPTVRYILNSQALGQSAAANIGINATSAEWIKHLDDDDWLAPNCLEVMTNTLNRASAAKFNPVLISVGATNVDINGRKIGQTPSIATETAGATSPSLLQLMMFDQVAIGTPVQVGHSRESSLRVGGWNERRMYKHLFGGDSEFWIRLAADGDSIFVPEALVFRTIWSGSGTNTTSFKNCYLTNIHLKDLLAEKLGIRTPQNIKCYLALNWAIIAFRARKFTQSFFLILCWLKRPDSIAYFVRRRNQKQIKKFLISIPK